MKSNRKKITDIYFVMILISRPLLLRLPAIMKSNFIGDICQNPTPKRKKKQIHRMKCTDERSVTFERPLSAYSQAAIILRVFLSNIT